MAMGYRGKEGDEDQSGGGWITSRTTCQERELSGEEAHDGAKWKRLVRHIAPT